MATAVTTVAVCNLALVHIGQGVAIASLTEKSEAAAQCAFLLPLARDEVLRDYPWPFATRSLALALLATNSSPVWSYAYRMPPDAVKPLGLLDVPEDTPWEIGGDTSGDLLLCDVADAVLSYITRVDDLSRWPSDLVAALAWKLGQYLAPVLARDKGREATCEIGYLKASSIAKRNAANQRTVSPSTYVCPGLSRGSGSSRDDDGAT